MHAIAALKTRVRWSRIADSHLAAKVRDHRHFVGPRELWDEMGQLQFDLLLDQGLKPTDTLLDVGCGSLRGGRHFIDYLDPGHYIGVDKHGDLIRRGLAKELPNGLADTKRPQFVTTGSFELPALEPQPTYALAQSLFSHLVEQDGRLCLARVREVVAAGCRFLVTYYESDTPVEAKASHSHQRLFLTRAQMTAMGAENGWRPEFVGDWGHPHGQQLMRYVAV